MRRREGGHGLENLVLLCSTDHRWTHANPEAARVEGFIVPTWVPVDEIAVERLRTWRGWTTLGRSGWYGERLPDENTE